MKLLNLQIKCCEECPYVSRSEYDESGWCKLKLREYSGEAYITDLNQIPDFCPLPDASDVDDFAEKRMRELEQRINTLQGQLRELLEEIGTPPPELR